MEDYKVGDKIWLYDFCAVSVKEGIILECHEAESCANVSFENIMYYMIDKKYIAPRNEKGKEKLKKIAMQRVEVELKDVEKRYNKSKKRLNYIIEELSRI